MRRDLALDLRYTRERLVPASLQFASNQPVGGISSVVLTEGAIGRIVRCFKVAQKCVAYLIAPLTGLPLDGDRGCDGAGPHHADKRFLDGIVDAQAAEGDALRLAIVHPGTVQL
ncbi:hypothetical protein ACE10Z_35130 [Bradyrhizobium sp. Pha-3]|uniref:hypothetical protein n=1 Tax=Bradyrhizobium sp. Pha-3 TaxID=208375 RepID=UPI0035D4C16E